LSEIADVDIWLEYCHFAIGNYESNSAESAAVTYEVFESALSHQGLNVASGTVLWEVYREFQLFILGQIPKEETQKIDEHLHRIDNLFRRQLSVPLMNMQNTLKDYEDFLIGVGSSLYNSDNISLSVPESCMQEYKKALAQLDLLMKYEEKIEDTCKQKDESSPVTVWETYLDWAFENTLGRTADGGTKRNRQARESATTTPSAQPLSPNQVCCLCERAVTAHCLYPSLWLRFVNYLEDVLGVDKLRLLRTYARAVRNCPWSVELWMRYAVATEVTVREQLLDGGTNGLDAIQHNDMENQALAKIEAVFETALLSGFPDQSDLLQLWTAYCDYRLRCLLRTSKNSSEWEIQLSNLRDAFQRATSELSQQFENNFDPEASLPRYHALIEAKFVGDMGAARSIWSLLMQSPGRGSQSKFWLAYLEFERNWGDVKHFLKTCRMAVNSISESFDTVFPLILRLSAEVGVTGEQYHELESRIRSHQRQLEQRRRSSADQGQATVGQPGSTGLTTVIPESIATRTQPRNRQKPTKVEIPGKKRAIAPGTEAVPKKKTKVERAKPSENSATVTKTSITSAPSRVHGESVPHDSSRENCTVFVSNLDYSTTESQLRTTFESCGMLTSVRLVRDYAGRSKGFAYVEFSDERCIPAALTLDRHPVLQEDSAVTTDGDADDQVPDAKQPRFARPMFVSRCDPTRRKTDAAFQFQVGHEEPEKLFVRNVDKSITKEALQTLFEQHGSVIDVRLATYRNGTPKGHAYVEFATAEDASRALVATDGLLVGTKQISVMISNPPIRNQSKSEPGTVAPSQSRSTHPIPADSIRQPQFVVPVSPVSKHRGHARTQLAFLPRAIHRASIASAVRPVSESTPGETAKGFSAAGKSNEDFRKMFLS
ncbi:Squamous cell carcinoma antigen recognized by T-cells 3, partial [Fasciolopsis buskii]